MSRIIFNASAKCDKAGRQQNQDNYWVCPNLSFDNQENDNLINNDSEIILSDNGALFIVADGMGGMNAGEKASELVVTSIKKRFKSIPTSVLVSDESILRFISDSIIYADERIKEYAKGNRDAEGLGSTIVLLWLYNDKAYCGWCGDSRIYRYNPNNNLIRLSHDHSYVQSLVDEGKITDEEAFEHPDSNIITRSLGDSGEKAKPETKVYDIFERDVFLLCSDGLCGLLQDKQIEEIVSIHCSSSKEALQALWKAGEDARWNDNATIELVAIESGGKIAKGIAQGYPPFNNYAKNSKRSKAKESVILAEKDYWYKRPIGIAILLAVIASFILMYYLIFDKNKIRHNTNTEYNIEVPNQSQQPVQPQRPQNQQQNQQPVQPQRPQNQQQNQQPVEPQRPQNQQQNQQSVEPQRPQNQQQNQQPAQQQQPQNQQQDQQQIQAPSLPSEAYIQQLNQTRNDYQDIGVLWNEVKRTQYISDRGEYNRLLGFAKNVKHLTDTNNPDFKRISQRQRSELNNWKALANDIEKNINRYIRNRNIRQQEYRGENQDDMYTL